MDEQMKIAIDRAAAALKAAGAKEVYLFGSAAAGKMHEHSDVDFAVSGLPPEKYIKAMGAARRALKRPMFVDLIDLDDKNLFTDFLLGNGLLKRVA